MRRVDTPKTTPLSDLTTRAFERMETRAFTRDYANSRHNFSNPFECRCTEGPICPNCPEREASRAA